MNVFNWTGPQFLFLYFPLLTVAVFAAIAMRYWLRQPQVPNQGEDPSLDPYELAFLAGGEKLALNAALANLVHHRALIVQNDKSLGIAGELPPDAHPLEQQVFIEVRRQSATSIKEVHAASRHYFSPLSRRLEELGLIPSTGQRFLIHLVPGLILLAVLALGAVKLGIGISRGKPIGFLAFLLGVTAVVTIVFFAKRVLRTWRGDRYLKEMRNQLAALETTAQSNTEALGGQDLVVALGLFGMGILTLGALGDLRRVILPPGASSSGSGCGSGCGGGSCGGGGGCGGGGCGGCGG